MMVKDWIDKLGTVWVEGQIAQLNVRPNSSTAYITLRDPAADMSLSITLPARPGHQRPGASSPRARR